MKRRSVLKALAGSLAAPSLFAYSRHPVARQKGNQRKLLVIFQRGGNDCLNTLIPQDSSEYAYYRSLRPTVSLNWQNLLDIPGSTFFRMHPGLLYLSGIMGEGFMSMIPAVGYPNPNRSHFESQSYLETAVPGNGSLSGWLNRYLSTTTGSGALIRGIGVGYNISQSLQGSVAIPVSSNFGRAEVSVDSNIPWDNRDPYRAKIAELMALAPTTGNDFVYDTGNRVFEMISAFQDRDLNNYVPENNASNPYPETGFGRSMMHAAQMLKDSPSYLGVEICMVNQGGYDTHANQINPANQMDTNSRHYSLLNELARSLAAFYWDMGIERFRDVVVLVVSEFGRRAYENDSFGTDHGTGGLAMVMGTRVSGQVHNSGSNWPGLAANRLYHGDLAWRTDFRDIYWEILSQHMGVSDANLAQIIPGHTYTPVGVL